MSEKSQAATAAKDTWLDFLSTCPAPLRQAYIHYLQTALDNIADQSLFCKDWENYLQTQAKHTLLKELLHHVLLQSSPQSTTTRPNTARNA